MNNELAIIIAFYLSKFNTKGVKNLGFINDLNAFESIGKILNAKKSYIKFRRDEFDPIHPWRKGWQRPMDNRIIKTIEALQDLEEPDLRDIVLGILHDKNYRESKDVKQITSLLSEDKKENASVGKFVLRAPTGKAAEEYFQSHYSIYKKPVNGKLIDCRDLGVGYDFRIEGETRNCFVEVKGLSEFSGGILFTSKEWTVARNYGENYFLCIVSNIGEQPQITFIQNHAAKLKPKRNIYTSIQIIWSISETKLNEFK